MKENLEKMPNELDKGVLISIRSSHKQWIKERLARV